MKKALLAFGLSSALLGGSAAWAQEATAVDAPNSPVTVVTTQTTPSDPIPVVTESMSSVEAAEPEAVLDTGDTAWILISTALVLLMTIPGLALFYAGMVRKKNVLSTMAHSFVAAAVVSITWIAVGYSLAFGDGNALLVTSTKSCSQALQQKL